MKKLIVGILVAGSCAVVAQTNAVVTITADAPVWLTDAVTKYPWIATVLLVMGALRIVFKPLCSAVHWYVDQTASEKDNAAFEKVEASKVFKAFSFILDYAASVKLNKK
jgi:hypothetical protein